LQKRQSNTYLLTEIQKVFALACGDGAKLLPSPAKFTLKVQLPGPTQRYGLVQEPYKPQT
jgi:hypothetical protein